MSNPTKFAAEPQSGGEHRSKGERTADRIREAALDQFSRLGFERVTMGGIAEAAGVSQPALHYHFQDKLALWRSAMGLIAQTIREEERATAAARDAPILAQLQMAMRFFLHVSWARPALGRIVALEGMAGGERLQWLIDNLIGPRNRRLVDLVRQAIAAGDLKPFPPEQILILLQTGAVGAVNLAPLMRANFGYDPETPEARAEHEEMVVTALLSGLVTDKHKAAEETR